LSPLAQTLTLGRVAIPRGRDKGAFMLHRFAVSILLVALCVAAPAVASAEGRHKHGGRGGGTSGSGGTDGTGGRRWIPEFDAATAGAVAVVLAGGGVVLARRRKR
jgi:hypothetical protein